MKKLRLLGIEYDPANTTWIRCFVNSYGDAAPETPTQTFNYEEGQHWNEEGRAVADFECFKWVNGEPIFKRLNPDGVDGKAILKQKARVYFQSIRDTEKTQTELEKADRDRRKAVKDIFDKNFAGDKDLGDE